MAVMMPREKWTDERLDELQAEMRAGFTRVEGDIKGFKGDVKRLDENVKRLDIDFRELRREMNSMNRNMMAGFFAMIAAIIGSNAF